MRKLTSVLVFALSGTSISAYAGGPAFPEALPPVGNPGECYGQVKIPAQYSTCLLYTSPSPRDKRQSRMPSSA